MSDLAEIWLENEDSGDGRQWCEDNVWDEGEATRFVRADSLALRDVIAERRRQVKAEGWTPAHDDEHDDGSLALAAAAYAEGSSGGYRVETVTDDVSGGRGDTPVWGKKKVRVPLMWPRSWCASWWKPSKDHRRNLVKAGALIIAEIERIDRKAASAPSVSEERG